MNKLVKTESGWTIPNDKHNWCDCHYHTWQVRWSEQGGNIMTYREWACEQRRINMVTCLICNESILKSEAEYSPEYKAWACLDCLEGRED